MTRFQSTFIGDSEYISAMVQRVCGSNVRIDVGKMRAYFEGLGHSFLWMHWYVQEPIGETPDACRRREGFYHLLRMHGVRPVVCQAKPINRLRNQHEPNLCDFEVSEGIKLGTVKASTVVVATGDGHLSAAIRNAHNQAGCRVEVFCDRSSLSSTIEADQFHFLEDMVATGIDITRRRPRAA